MKRFLLFASILLFSLSGYSQGFEGSFTMATESYSDETKSMDPMKTDISFFIKGDKTLMETKVEGMDGNLKVLMDESDDAVYTLMSQGGQKMAMKNSLSQIQNMADKGTETMENDDYEVTKTSESKTIDGYSCTKYNVTSTEYDGHFWATQELDFSYEELMESINMQGKKSKKTKVPNYSNFGEYGVPLEMYMKEKGGESWIKMDIKNLKEEAVSDKVFDISGYRVMDMQGMMMQDR